MSLTVMAGTDRRRNLRQDAMPAGFTWHVRDALAHLHDPAHLQRHPLALLVQWQRGGSASECRTLREHFLDAIGALRPQPDTAVNSHFWRNYHLLTLRYVEARDAATVQARLAISKSEYYRDHQRAVEAVGSLLQARWRDAEGTTLPAISFLRPGRAAPPGQLPIALTSFIGRERDIAMVEALLARSRLLTLTGPPGVGKSRLALEIAADVVDAFPDGVYMVPLAPVRDPDLVISAIAQAFAIQDFRSQPLLDRLKSTLRDQRLLLVLDNFEQVVAAAPLVTELLGACRGLKALVTSRAVLRVDGEHDFPVPPLAVPDPTATQSIERLLEYAAVQLFVDRAVVAAPAFTVTSENASAVAHICNYLDGLPLALELAAARLRMLSVYDLAARLSDRFRVLTRGSQSALPHHQTLRATVDWSYDLLTELERVLLRRLSVFAGGWTLEAAEAVCADEGIWELEDGKWHTEGSRFNSHLPSPISRDGVLDLLGDLVDKSLVLVDRQSPSGSSSPRYRLLETIRQYGREKLVAAGELAQVKDQHLLWFLRLAEQAHAERAGPQQTNWLDRMEQEIDNIRAALEYAATRTESELGLHFASLLWRFWSNRGHMTEGRTWLARLLAANGGDAVPSRAHRVARSQALEAAAILARYQGGFRAAYALHEAALTLRRALGDPWDLAESLNGMGALLRVEGEYDRAEATLRESLAVSREFADTLMTYRALQFLGDVLYCRGAFDQANVVLREALALERAHGDNYSIAIALQMLGTIARVQGQYGDAGALLEESLALARQQGDMRSVAKALSGQAYLALDTDARTMARARLRECLPLQERLSLREDIARSLDGFAALAAVEAHPDRALRLAGAGTGLRDAIGARLSPVEQAEHERRLAPVRNALAAPTIAETWAAGQALTLEQAIAEALDQADDG